MFSVDQTSYGVKIMFSGAMNKEEMSVWLEESKRITSKLPSKFGVFVDMRNLKPLEAEAQKVLEEGQKHYKIKGMERSVVIVNNPIVKMQFTRLAKQSGIYEWERYIDASQHGDWEKRGEAWLTSSIDPDH
ncbi:MAG TPA: hypothetical protein PKZ69_02525 [Candidatus Cloacimonadota bacterium]|nr:hypothetical protein [Candidatus Cloacimonadota bacterium]HOQ79660.1 hypothetical protein [Candidatus Cloacimonadota bacterium]HPK40472.1 hypothetical protein [Candidatus Cloacimonadota bacterium]